MAVLNKVVEALVEMPIPGTSYTYKGKLDLIDGTTLIDYKSASNSLDFTDRKAMSFQTELYALAAFETLGIEIDRVEYRIVTRPSIKFCGKDKTSDSPVVNAGNYERRCYEWLNADPMLVRSEVVPVSAGSRESAREWLALVANRIERNGYAGEWLTNEYACSPVGLGSCPYIALCHSKKHGTDQQIVRETQYKKRAQLHSELGDANPNILTYSSAACFAQCEAKYFWRYEVGLEKQKEEHAEALYVGSALHVGMEAVVEGGIVEAYTAIELWAKENRVIGQDAHERQLEQIAKARAMCRVASEKWLLN